MSYLERIKKLSTYSHLPNFAILSNNKLYLPNSDNQYTILGKWSLDWINSNRCAIGTVEQDTYHNVTFQITSSYDCTDDETTFQLIPKNIFTEFWNRVYHHEPLLSYIHINISEFYQSSSIISPILTKSIPSNGLIEITGGSHIKARTVLESPKYQSQPKEKIIDTVITPKNQPKEEKPKQQTGKSSSVPEELRATLSGKSSSVPEDLRATISGKSWLAVKDSHTTISGDKFQVCKTDKPDVYHVHQGNKYVSTCLIPNMKTSRYMQDAFEDKQIGEMVTMNMKLHVNTNKYYPII